MNFWRGIFGFVPHTIGDLELAAAAVFIVVVWAARDRRVAFLEDRLIEDLLKNRRS